MISANNVTLRIGKKALFEDVVKRYNFDRKLRLILFDAIKIIEVALRTKIITNISISAGDGLWYLDKQWFEREDYHEDLVLLQFSW